MKSELPNRMIEIPLYFQKVELGIKRSPAHEVNLRLSLTSTGGKLLLLLYSSTFFCLAQRDVNLLFSFLLNKA